MYQTPKDVFPLLKVKELSVMKAKGTVTANTLEC